MNPSEFIEKILVKVSKTHDETNNYQQQTTMTTMATTPGNVTEYIDQPELKPLRVTVLYLLNAFSICVLSLAIGIHGM